MPMSVIDVSKSKIPIGQVFSYNQPVDKLAIWADMVGIIELWGYIISSDIDGEIQLFDMQDIPISPVIYVEPRVVSVVALNIPLCRIHGGLKISSNIISAYGIQLVGYLV